MLVTVERDSEDMVVFVVKRVCCPCGILSAVVYCNREGREDSSLQRVYTLSFEFSFDSHAYPWDYYPVAPSGF